MGETVNCELEDQRPLESGAWSVESGACKSWNWKGTVFVVVVILLCVNCSSSVSTEDIATSQLHGYHIPAVYTIVNTSTVSLSAYRYSDADGNLYTIEIHSALCDAHTMLLDPSCV